MTRPVPTIVDEAPPYSSNDSHIHVSPEQKARREKLGISLKPGETDEVTAAGPQHLCKVCSPNGEVPPPEAPSNRTYDRSLDQAKEDENDALKRRVEQLEEMIRGQNKTKAPAQAGARA